MAHWPVNFPPPITSAFSYRREEAARINVTVESGHTFRRLRHHQTILLFSLSFDMTEDQVIDFFWFIKTHGITFTIDVPAPEAEGFMDVDQQLYTHPMEVTIRSNPVVTARTHEVYTVSFRVESRLDINALPSDAWRPSPDWIVAGSPPSPSPGTYTATHDAADVVDPTFQTQWNLNNAP